MKDIRIHTVGLLATSGTLAIWIVLAVRSPDLTYHFAPLIAAGLWPALTGSDEPPPVRTSLIAGAGAFLLVAAVTAGLAVGGYLEGPTFWNEGPAATEAILFAVLGAGLGTVIARRPRTSEQPGDLSQDLLASADGPAGSRPANEPPVHDL